MKIEVVRIKLERTGEKIEHPKFQGPESVYDFLNERIGKYDREVFVTLHLDTKNNINTYEEVSMGSVNASIVHPREVFKAAIKANATSILLSHNHPSGNPSPSREDIKITERLVECGDILGIKVLDHIIIGHNEYYSMKENGLI